MGKVAGWQSLQSSNFSHENLLILAQLQTDARVDPLMLTWHFACLVRLWYWKTHYRDDFFSHVVNFGSCDELLQKAYCLSASLDIKHSMVLTFCVPSSIHLKEMICSLELLVRTNTWWEMLNRGMFPSAIRSTDNLANWKGRHTVRITVHRDQRKRHHAEVVRGKVSCISCRIAGCNDHVVRFSTL